MSLKYFDLIGYDYADVKFVCPNCKTQCEATLLEIPDIINVDDEPNPYTQMRRCPNCFEGHYIVMYVGSDWGNGNGKDKSYIEFDSLGRKVNIGDITAYENGLGPYYNHRIDSILNDESSIKSFFDEIGRLFELYSVQLNETSLQVTLNRLIYSGGITCMEDYLSTTLIQIILSDQNYLKEFVKTYKGFKNHKVELNNIYDKLNGIQDIVKKELLGIIYHDLPKVKGIYEDTLKIEFPAIDSIMKRIIKRHDMVHRNGKSKDGKEIKVDKTELKIHLNEIQNFVLCIHAQIDISYDPPAVRLN